MPLLDDIAYHIENEISESTGYTIGKGYKGNSPDKQIVVYETGGMNPETTMGIDYPQFQVCVRGEKFEGKATQIVAMAVYTKLHKATIIDQDVSPSVTYVYCYAMGSGLLPLGNDENDRPEFVINFRMMRSF